MSHSPCPPTVPYPCPSVDPSTNVNRDWNLSEVPDMCQLLCGMNPTGIVMLPQLASGYGYIGDIWLSSHRPFGANIKNGFTIQAKAGVVLIKAPTASTPLGGRPGVALRVTGCANVVFMNITFSGACLTTGAVGDEPDAQEPNASQPSSGYGLKVDVGKGPNLDVLTLSGCEACNNSVSGILTANMNHVTAAACSAHDNLSQHGLYFSQSGDALLVSGGTFSNNGRTGIQVNAHDPQTQGGNGRDGITTGLKITGNVILEQNQLLKLGAALNILAVQGTVAGGMTIDSVSVKKHPGVNGFNIAPVGGNQSKNLTFSHNHFGVFLDVDPSSYCIYTIPGSNIGLSIAGNGNDHIDGALTPAITNYV